MCDIKCDAKSKDLVRKVGTLNVICHEGFRTLALSLTKFKRFFSDSSHFPAYRKLMSECAELCYEVAAAVFPVVGSDSPEGYVPEVRPEMELPNVYKEKYERILRALRAQQMPGVVLLEGNFSFALAGYV